MNKKKKKLLIAGITILVLACIVGGYSLAYKMPQPMMDCMNGTEPPITGTVVCHTFDNQTDTFTVEDPQQLTAVWDAIQTSTIRFVQGRAIATIPKDGAFYEVSLYSSPEGQEDGSTYIFGMNSEGKVFIVGSSYALVGESSLLPALEDLFQEAGEN